jgi:transposase
MHEYWRGTGLTTKTHLVADGKWRALAFVLTSGQVADTTMLPDTLDEIRVAGASGRPRQRPDRLLADKGYPSRANRAWRRERGIATTIPERDDQIAHRRKRPGRPIDFGDEQRQRYRAATSSSAASTSSSSGAGSRYDQTRPPATTTPVSASPPHSNGSRP